MTTSRGKAESTLAALPRGQRDKSSAATVDREMRLPGQKRKSWLDQLEEELERDNAGDVGNSSDSALVLGPAGNAERSNDGLPAGRMETA